jgi:lipid-A-disaccharide synthase
MKYYIIAGEASGDLHGSNLVKHFLAAAPQTQVRAWGGDLLRRAGAEVVKDYSELAFMGFIDVAMNCKTILRNMRFCKKDMIRFQPDAVILIDYPGFNLRMSKFLHRHRIPVFYYISPQIWAWHKSRIKSIKRYVNQMFVILPFEKAFYAQHDLMVHYFGHPLSDLIGQYRVLPPLLPVGSLKEEKIIALLPGSRKQEIRRMLPVMLAATKQITGYQYVIAGVKNHQSLYEHLVQGYDIPVCYGQTYDILAHAHAAMVTSGTATLETALFHVPQVVCYKADYVSYLIAKNLVKGIDYISLVNLIADKKIVTELIQHQFTADNLVNELQILLRDTRQRKEMLDHYTHLHHLLGQGNVSGMIAQKMLELTAQAIKERS